MAIITRTDVLECDVCGHEWLPERGKKFPPNQCPSRKCRSSKWNGGQKFPQRNSELEMLDSQKRADSKRLTSGEGMGVEKLQEKKEPYSVPPVDGIKPKETDKPRQRKTESGETRIDDSDEYRQ